MVAVLNERFSFLEACLYMYTYGSSAYSRGVLDAPIDLDRSFNLDAFGPIFNNKIFYIVNSLAILSCIKINEDTFIR